MFAHHLPLYKTTYDLIFALFHSIKKFPKEFKYTLGEQLKKESLELIVLVIKAYHSSEKQALLDKATGTLESLRVLFRISKDLHLIPLEKFTTLQISLESISKQLTAW